MTILIVGFIIYDISQIYIYYIYIIYILIAHNAK